MAEEERLYFEDLNVGDEAESGGRTVTEADVVGFAAVSGDYNRLHIDEEFAKNSVFGKRVAHGMLGLAMCTGQQVMAMEPKIRTLAFLGLGEWVFKGPIFPGDTIRAKRIIESKRETSKADRGIVVYRMQVLNQRDEVVQEGTWNLMVARRQ